jgi:Rod binding domain-containing protein
MEVSATPYIKPMAGHAPKLDPKLDQKLTETAQEFEAVFLQNMLSIMFQGIETDEYFGGGAAEDTFRSMQIEQYSKHIASQGGIGLASFIKQALIDLQASANQ